MNKAVALFLFAVLVSAPLYAEDFVVALHKEAISMLTEGAAIGWSIASDGNTVMEVSGVPRGGSTPTKYFTYRIELPEAVDVSGKVVIVCAQTDTPEVLEGFYFRAYNEGETAAALSFLNWKNPIQKTYANLTMIPGESGVMRWEADNVSESKPTRIKTLRIDMGTRQVNKKMNIRIKEIKFVDHPYALMNEALKPFAQYTGFGQSSFTRNPQLFTYRSGNKVIIRCVGLAPEETAKNASHYEAFSLKFSPVDLRGRTIALDLKALSPNITRLYIRLFNDREQRPVMSFVKNTLPRAWATYYLVPGAKGLFQWEPKIVSGAAFSNITRIDVIFNGTGPGPFGIEIRDLKLR